ncbi:KH domain-containing, RNA-binding, signal transduction-associated protein 2-like isoform X3 [Zootermopsis nevadensis]|uniref:KH domain-containing, RNA-binding, signal transduction-associated protein 2-like isoform X3 n=1 Tax=Zootermopsis nevadensis TaxID=136037 RepID=UPI000B8ED011|nr:KH domain-containing, RNA-binding, signal transduction-associated protein 2-like isoform X3 [Zootermopsis nevadensis]
MADNSSSNGEIKLNTVSSGGINSSSVGESNINTPQQDFTTMKSATSEMEMEATSVGDKAGDYVRELLHEKQSLDSSQWPNALRLLDQEVTREVARVQASGKPLPKESKYVDIYREKPIRVAVKVLVPIKEHPKFNFVGKLLGPKGNSMKRLQEDTMTKMAVLGRGSMKDKQKEEELRASLDPKYAHLSDDLHVEIAAFAPPAEAHARIAYALAEVRKYLIPDSNDEIRQEQMREMELIQTVTEPGAAGSNNGTPPSGVRKPVRGGLRGRGGGGIAIRGAVGGLRGGIPPLRGGGRGLLTPPAGVLHPRGGPAGVRKPLPPPQALLPRPTPTKTKVLSILDRARVAMEESYGCEDDMGGNVGGFYESSAYDSYNATGYGTYEDYDEGSGDYYDSTEGYPGQRCMFSVPPACGVKTREFHHRKYFF